MICANTLRVRNLPQQLSDLEKEELLVHFGAVTVKVLTSKYRQKSVAYAKFETEEIAKNVLFRLHQLKVLDSVLCVEFADREIGCERAQTTAVADLHSSQKHLKAFIGRLNAFNSSVAFNQPPPPHLKYSYPKPNRATLNNIAHALASVPKFYTQVLHLMNRMNLPPPFSNIPDPPPQHQVKNPPPPPPKAASTSESELESDSEADGKTKPVVPSKRAKPAKKPLKRPKFVKPPAAAPAAKPGQKPEEVFEKVELQGAKKIELKVPAESIDAKAPGVDTATAGGFGVIEAAPRPKTPPGEGKRSPKDEGNEDEGRPITEEELAANRIPAKDLGILPVFKNYHPGAPSCRLYIKNLAKVVQEKDLAHIYRRYVIPEENQEQGSMFDIRLMQEGRMKGQAFITLQSVAQAQKALSETNGFILKEKPLVVVFARSAVPKSK